MLTPLGINEVTSPAVCNSSLISDNFDGTSLDMNKWDKDAGRPNESIAISNGTIVMESPEANNGVRLISKNTISGDFSATIDIKTPVTTGISSNSKFACLVFRSPNNDNSIEIKSVVICRDGNGQIITYPNHDQSSSASRKVDVSSNQNANVKIVRQGSNYKTYYKTTNDYVLLGDFQNVTNEPVTARINVGPADSIRILKTSATFDNFSISCIAPNKPPAPTNPRITCNPDGKSVRLMWDTVGDAQSYKARVDDKAGKVTPYDGISKGEYVATINPNQTYTWWAHSSKDGVDSAETPRQDFKCTPTATPTPTPKPTAKPTATPTVAPTPTPTTQAYVIASPKASTFAYENVSAEPTPTTTVSKNPISRFFTWLASLFE